MRPESIRSVVETYFEPVPSRSTHDELVFICPEEGCGDKSGNRSVSLKTGKTTCWRCGAIRGHSGSFQAWARRFNITVEDDDQTLTASDMDDLSLSLNKDVHESGYVSEVSLPRGFTPLSKDPNGAYARLIGRMARAKHLSLDDFIQAGVGYTREDPGWEPYAIFPVLEWGRTVYYQGRLYGKPEPGMKGTKRFPSKHTVPVGAKYWVYGIDMARAMKAKRVVIVESILNVLSFNLELEARGERDTIAVAVFKHAVSAPQRKKILALPGLREIVMLFDDDAMSSSWQSALDMTDNVTVTVCSMPTGVDANDDAQAAYRAYQERKGVNSASLLEARLRFGV